MSYPKKIMAAIAASAMILAEGCGNDAAPKTAVVPNDNDQGFVTAAVESKTTLPKVRPAEEGGGSITDKPDNGTSTSPAGSGSADADENDQQQTENDIPQADDTSTDEDSETPSSPASTTSSAGKNEPATAAQEDIYYLEGIVCENSGKFLLINETDLGKVSVSFKSGVKTDSIKAGDRVLITYDGYLLETYPSQAKNASSIKTTEGADKKYTLEHFTKNDLAFSVLVPEDWSSREIDYPTEGDFTDWGIRFAPEGENGGLDISWHSAFAIREPYDITPAEVNRNSVDIYSKDGVWRYYVYDNNYIAAASFYDSQDYSQYIPEMEFMLETLEFE